MYDTALAWLPIHDISNHVYRSHHNSSLALIPTEHGSVPLNPFETENYIDSTSQIPHRPHLEPRIAVKRFAPELQRKGMYDTCLPWLFMWNRIPCVGRIKNTWCRRFVLPSCCTTGCDHVTLLPNTFPPHTFIASFRRTSNQYHRTFSSEKPY